MIPTSSTLPPISQKQTLVSTHPGKKGLVASRKISKSPVWEVVKKVTFIAIILAATGASIPLTGGYTAAIVIGGGSVAAIFLYLFVSKLMPKQNNISKPEVEVSEGSEIFFEKQSCKVEKIAQTFESQGKEVDDQTLDQILTLVDETRKHVYLEEIRLYNQEALTRLRAQIYSEFHDSSLLDKVLNTEDLEDFINGKRRLGVETEQTILTGVKEIYEQEQGIQELNFTSLLEKIKESASRDLFLDESYIEKKFEVDKALSSLTPEQTQKRREELKIVINKAFVLRELKQRGKLTIGNPEEVQLLDYLGYRASKAGSPYQDKQAIYEVIQSVVQTQLSKETYQSSLSAVKDVLNQIFLEVRLKAAGLKTSLQNEKFQLAKEILKSTQEELANQSKKYELKLPASFPLKENSPNLKVIQEKFEYYKKQVNNRFLKHVFSNAILRDGFIQENLSSNAFVKQVQQHVQGQMVKNAEKLDVKWNKQGLDIASYSTTSDAKFIAKEDELEVNKQILFFQKWGGYLKAEMVQGVDDPHAVLENGICFGLCLNLQINSINNPDFSLEELIKRNTIGSVQRFFHGIYVGANRLKHVNIFPPEFAHRYGVEEKGIFGSIDTSKVSQKRTKKLNPTLQKSLSEGEALINMPVKEFEKYLQITDVKDHGKGQLIKGFQEEIKKRDWSASLGWTRLSLLGESHTISTRIDSVNNNNWIFDSNIGYFDFEEPGVSFEESRDKSLDCLKDIFDLYYPDIVGIGVMQTQPYSKKPAA